VNRIEVITSVERRRPLKLGVEGAMIPAMDEPGAVVTRDRAQRGNWVKTRNRSTSFVAIASVYFPAQQLGIGKSR
jgi:hypothetical protein